MLLMIFAVIFTACTTKQNDPVVSTYNNNSSTSNYTYSNNSSNDTSWFSGGTLHKSTIREWRNATYSNRLATAADFISATQDVNYGDLESFKQMAMKLETCISETASGGDVDNEETSYIGALCTVMLFQ